MSTTADDETPASVVNNRAWQRQRYWDFQTHRREQAPAWMDEITSTQAVAAYIGEHFSEGSAVNPSDVARGCRHPGATPTKVRERFVRWYATGYLERGPGPARFDPETRRWKRYDLVTGLGDRHFTAEALAVRYIATRHEET